MRVGDLRIRSRPRAVSWARQLASAWLSEGLGVRTGEIARRLGITPSAVSQHLAKARAEGLSADLEKEQLP